MTLIVALLTWFFIQKVIIHPLHEITLGTEFPGIEVVACESCGQYFKELDLRKLYVDDFIWEDVRTLPLNYAAEQWVADHAKVSGKIL